MAVQTRPPVVTILGHVDHGKTTLLDFIRKTSVAAKEFGGITQAIGAYQVEHDGKTITFIDTPGHAAFEKMRARGAQLADIAVLVVAVDDGVMPQTVEAIKHILTANIPMIVAINKVDLPGIDIKVQTERIKKQLSDNKVLAEAYGGDVPVALVSAKTGNGVPDLLDTINLVAEINELKGDPERQAVGIVIESHLDKFKGSVATVLVRDGTLEKRETIAVQGITAKVRGMYDFAGKSLDKAGPSTPVEVLGFSEVPPIGAIFGEEVKVVEKEEKTKVLSLIDKLKEEKEKLLNVIIKADKQGSLEAIETLIEQMNKEEQHIKIISSGTGDILDSDIELAKATGAIVLGFNVKTVPTASKMADTNNVLIRTYKVIYELADELEDVVTGILVPGKVEEVFARAQVLAEFPFGKMEKIAGCKVLEGTFSKGPKVRIVRGDEIIGETKIKSLKKAKEEVQKAEKGNECGMIFEPAIDFQVGDLVESFRLL